MNRAVSVTIVTLLLLVLATPIIDASSSGRHNSATGCNCHYSGSSPTINHNIPSAYNAGQQYTINISVSGVSGTKGGFNLEVDKGTLSSPGVGTGSVKFTSNGLSATHTTSNNRAWSFAWTAPSTGSGSAFFELAGMAANGNGQNSGDSWGTTTVTVPEVPQGNQPPSASNAILSPSSPTTSETLTLNYNYNDPDGDAESGSIITWYRDGNIVASQNGLQSVSSSLTQKGQQWRATITPSDGTDQGNEISSNTVTIQNTAPVAGTPTLTPGNPDTDANIAIVSTSSDADSDQLSMETRWFLDDAVVNSLNDVHPLPAYATRAGDVWFGEVRFNDGEATSTWQRTNSVTIGGQNEAPIIQSAQLSPNQPYTIDDISLAYTSNDPDSDPVISTETRWYKNEIEVQALSGQLAIPSERTVAGDEWKAQVRVSDGQAWSDWFWSNEVIVLNSNPVTIDLTLTESLTTTENITAQFSIEDVDMHELNIAMSEIVWTKNGSVVQSLNGQTTVPSSMTSKGEIWQVSVRGSDGFSLSSNTLTATSEVINSIPNISVQLDSSPSSDQNLSLSITSSDSDNDELTYVIKWYRNGFKAGQFENLSVISSDFLGPGQIWRVEAVAYDGQSFSVSSTSEATIANTLPNPVISVLEENLWIGETITLDASQSFDSDGLITNAIWVWSDSLGNGGQLIGMSRELVLESRSATIQLTVIDDSGGRNTTTRSIVLTSPPTITNFDVSIDGVEANLDWDWSGPQANFNVYRNGVLIAVVENSSYTDSPELAGAHTWSVSAVIGDVEIGEDESDLSTTTALDLSSLDETGAPSATGGLILGIIFIVFGFGGLLLALNGGRDE